MGCIYIYIFFSCLFIFERDRAWTGEGQRERETQNRKQAPGSQPSAQSLTRGSNSRTARSWPGWSRTLNRLRHPATLNVYLFLRVRERERERAWTGKRQKERERESKAGSRLWAVSTEPNAGLESTNREIMTWAKIGRLTDRATQMPLTPFFTQLLPTSFSIQQWLLLKTFITVVVAN